MLSIANIRSAEDAKIYFESDNYYAKGTPEAEKASQWFGRGAEKLGLSGAVNLDTFEEVLGGLLPNGEVLGRMEKGVRVHRPGIDLTFSAPKSLSLLIGIHKEETIRAIHERAVKRTLAHIQDNLIYTRSMVKGKIVYEKVDNITVALHHHETSRENDPQIHTHCVLANAVERADGKWRSISNESLYENKMLLGVMYRYELAKELIEQGYQIEKTDTQGCFEIKGFSEEQLNSFSTRRKQIEQELRTRGLQGAKASAIVTRDSRKAKQAVDRDQLHESWLKAAESNALPLKETINSARKNSLRPSPLSIEKIDELTMAAANRLNERSAVLAERDIFRLTIGAEIGQISLQQAEEAVSRLVNQGQLVRLDEGVYTTAEYFALEKENVTILQKGKEKLTPIISDTNQLNTELAVQVPIKGGSRDKFTQGQQRAIETILTTKDRIVGIQGDAGTGKTTMLKEVKQHAEKAGFHVVGLSPKADAAKILQHETGIQSDTLKAFLLKGSQTVSRKQLLIVDEASTISTREMNAFLKKAESMGHNVHIALVGDRDQLNAVEAGNPYLLFQDHDMTTAYMSEVLRQKNESLKKAVLSAKKGDIETAFKGVNIREERQHDLRLNNVVDDYMNRSKDLRARTMVLSASNADRTALNDMIRNRLKQEGSLAKTSIDCTSLQSRDLTKEETKRVEAYHIGDHIKLYQKDVQANLHSRHYYEVLSIDKEKGLLHVVDEKGNRCKIKPDYNFARQQPQVFAPIQRELSVGDRLRWTSVIDKANDIVTSRTATVTAIHGEKITLDTGNNQSITIDQHDKKYMHFDYAYAATVYSVQGATTDQVIASLDSSQVALMNQSLFYVLMSRSKYDVTLHLDDKKECMNIIQERLGQKANALGYSASTKQEARYQPQAQGNHFKAPTKQPLQNQPINTDWQIDQVDYPQDNDANFSDYSEYTQLMQQSSPTTKTNIQAEAPQTHINDYNDYVQLMQQPHPSLKKGPHKSWDLDALQKAAAPHIRDLAETLLGEPNARLSNGQQLRYGSKGALVISRESGKEGLWFDHSSGESGNIFGLVARERGLSKKESFDFIGNFIGFEKKLVIQLSLYK